MRIDESLFLKTKGTPYKTAYRIAIIGVAVTFLMVRPVMLGETYYLIRVVCPSMARRLLCVPLAQGKDDERLPSITLEKMHSVLQFYTSANALPTNQYEYDRCEVHVFGSTPIQDNLETRCKRTYEYDCTSGVYTIWVQPLPELPQLYIMSTNTRPVYAFTNDTHVVNCVSALVTRIHSVSRYNPTRYWRMRLPNACLVEIAPLHESVKVLEQIADDPFEMWPLRKLAQDMRILANLRSQGAHVVRVGNDTSTGLLEKREDEDRRKIDVSEKHRE